MKKATIESLIRQFESLIEFRLEDGSSPFGTVDYMGFEESIKELKEELKK